MATTGTTAGIPDERITIERRANGTLVVRVRSEFSEGNATRLPDAVFSFRNGDPQYAYWLGRFNARRPG